jgi:hypothetical protein
MASFLKNTGDIILDAVLTDEGRRRLAMGDGSFKITKFALGDDEIDYSLWLKDNPSGLQDSQIMQTPIFEAYTNNAASMNNKLITLAETNLLFLPVIKLNTLSAPVGPVLDATAQAYIIPVDPTNIHSLDFKDNPSAFLKSGDNKIFVDQGLDSADLDKTVSLVDFYPNLVENAYNVFLDSRLMTIQDATAQSIDDDYIAMYSFSLNDNFVTNAPVGTSAGNGDAGLQLNAVAGNRGTRLSFRPLPTLQIEQTGDSLFKKLGSLNAAQFNNNYYDVIRTMIKVTGATTGYSIEIPILLARYNN